MTPEAKPLTMSPEREAEIRYNHRWSPGGNVRTLTPDTTAQLLAELDAERAAHGQTQERLEATLAHFDNLFGAEMHSMLGLIERDSAMKQEVRSLRAQLERTQGVNARLREALEPFRKEIETMDASGPGFPNPVLGCRADWNALRIALAEAAKL